MYDVNAKMAVWSERREVSEWIKKLTELHNSLLKELIVSIDIIEAKHQRLHTKIKELPKEMFISNSSYKSNRIKIQYYNYA